MPASSFPFRHLPWLIVLVLLAGGFLFATARHESAASRNNECAPGEERCVSASHSAVKLLPEKEPYRFVAFGDWGAGTQFQKDVAAQLFRTFDQTPFQAVLMLGDNIYERGEVNKYGDARFTKMYAPLIEKGVSFVVALGNHDVMFGHRQAQIKFFKMPGSYYSAVPPEKDLQYFVIDSNTYANDKAQQQWLTRALTNSKAPCKIVMGHHPIYSSGEHGNNAGLHRTLEPLMIKHKVTLYLAGHDHEYERFKAIQGVSHMVSGGGGAYLRDFERKVPGSLVRAKRHGFALFEYRDGILYMRAVDKKGEVFDKATYPVNQAPLKLPKAS